MLCHGWPVTVQGSAHHLWAQDQPEITASLRQGASVQPGHTQQSTCVTCICRSRKGHTCWHAVGAPTHAQSLEARLDGGKEASVWHLHPDIPAPGCPWVDCPLRSGTTAAQGLLWTHTRHSSCLFKKCGLELEGLWQGCLVRRPVCSLQGDVWMVGLDGSSCLPRRVPPHSAHWVPGADAGSSPVMKPAVVHLFCRLPPSPGADLSRPIRRYPPTGPVSPSPAAHVRPGPGVLLLPHWPIASQFFLWHCGLRQTESASWKPEFPARMNSNSTWKK